MHILITGTSTGVGAGLAQYYISQQRTVWGISRKTNEELGVHDSFHFLSQDLSDFSEVEKNLPSFLKTIPSLDLVVLNAGILNEIKDLKDTSMDEIHRTMNINVWANKIFIDLLFTYVSEIKQVVAISSGASVSGSRGFNAYSLSKATLNMLVKLYSKEHQDTHFCSLAPGLIDTKMQEYVSGLPDNEDYPSIMNLKKMRGTEHMPDPQKAAVLIAEGIEQVKSSESGSFVDIRNL